MKSRVRDTLTTQKQRCLNRSAPHPYCWVVAHFYADVHCKLFRGCLRREIVRFQVLCLYEYTWPCVKLNEFDLDTRHSFKMLTFESLQYLKGHWFDIFELIGTKAICLLIIIGRLTEYWEDKTNMTVKIKGIEYFNYRTLPLFIQRLQFVQGVKLKFGRFSVTLDIFNDFDCILFTCLLIVTAEYLAKGAFSQCCFNLIYWKELSLQFLLV